MKKQFTATLLPIFCAIFSFQVKAQVSLPYSSGFNNTSDLEAWEEFQLIPSSFSSWETNTMSGYGGSGSIGHDYAPSTADSVVDDWFVSPEFSIPNGGSLDSLRYKFSGFSTPQAGDTIGLYLLQGSQDPSLASATILLKDFRDTSYTADNVWHIISNIDLQSFTGASYFGIRYRSIDVSSQWLTVGLDNFAISEIENVGQDELTASDWTIYPNPSSGIVVLDSEIEYASIKIFNGLGQLVYEKVNLDTNSRLELDLSSLEKGVYWLNLDGSSQKIIIQ